MFHPESYDIKGGAIAQKSLCTSEKDQDKKTIKDLGRSMRFFLNLSFLLIMAFPVFIIMGSQWITNLILMAYLILVITTIIFSIAFCSLLNRIGKYANKGRNIDLASRVIWEYNKSSLIRLAIGKTKTFIDSE